MGSSFKMLVAALMINVIGQIAQAEETNKKIANYAVRCRVVENAPVMKTLCETTWNAIQAHHCLLVEKYSAAQKMAAQTAKENKWARYNTLFQVKEHESRHIVVDAVQRPFVIAVSQIKNPKTAESAFQPVIQVVDQGMNVDFKLLNVSAGLMTLDTSIELTEVTSSECKPITDEVTVQIPHVETAKIRKIDTVRFNEEISIPINVGETKRRLIMQVTKRLD